MRLWVELEGRNTIQRNNRSKIKMSMLAVNELKRTVQDRSKVLVNSAFARNWTSCRSLSRGACNRDELINKVKLNSC